MNGRTEEHIDVQPVEVMQGLVGLDLVMADVPLQQDFML